MKMRLSLVASLLAGAVLLTACAAESSGPPLYSSLARSDAKVDAGEASSLINRHREIAGLRPLVIDAALMREAQAHASDMAAAEKIGHDISRGNLKSRLTAGGVALGVAAENVGAGYHTLAEAFSGWRGSPPHDKNLLLPEGKRMGIAAAYAPGSKYKVFWAFIVAGD